jgi:predicted RNA-binding Zn ribbon-like protein
MTSDVRLDWRAEAEGGSVVPDELALVKAFLNSADIEEGSDAFETDETLRAWLRERGLPGEAASLTELDRLGLVEFREAIREIVAAHGSSPPPEALRVVGVAAQAALLVVEVGPDGSADLRPTGHGAHALVGRLLADVASAQRIGTWRNLRICRRDVCRWAFYDASRNHSGVWCTMSICGNRTKSARLRYRRRAAAPGSGQRRKVLAQVPSQTT